MLKQDVLAKLEEYKGRQIEVCLSDEGITLYSGIEGHWIFTKDDYLIEVKKNSTTGTYGVSQSNQFENPFIITVTSFDMVSCVKTYISHKPGDVATIITGLTPVGTLSTFDEIKNQIESDSIFKALSPRGNLNVDDVAPGGSYGVFKGSVISTDIDGLPTYMDSIITE